MRKCVHSSAQRPERALAQILVAIAAGSSDSQALGAFFRSVDFGSEQSTNLTDRAARPPQAARVLEALPSGRDALRS